MKLKHPLDIGMFVQRQDSKILRDSLLLVCSRTKEKDKWRYDVVSFWYSPNSVSDRLRLYSYYPFSILSSVLDRQGGQIVDVAKGEIAK